MEKLRNPKPLIRFKEFKDNWNFTQLKNLLSVSKNKNQDLKYGIEDVLSVSGDLGIVNQIEHLGRSYAGASVHNYGVVELNQIVYTKSPLKSNPYGIIKLNKHKAGIVSTLYAVYSVKDCTHSLFIEYYFSLDDNLNRYLRPLVRKGAKNDMKISDEYVLNDKIFIPSLSEQQKIASFLTSVDDKINLLTKKKELLEKYKKGVMQKIFSQEIRFKDDNGNDFTDWDKKTLSECCYFVDGYSFKSSSYSNSGTYNIVTISNVQNGNMTDGFNKVKIIPSGVNDNQKLKKGDILISMTGNVGRVCRVSYENCLLNQRVGKIIPKEINSFFLFFILNNAKFINSMERISEGAAQKNLSKKNILRYSFNSPTQIEEEEKIGNFLFYLDKKIDLVESQLDKTKEFKKGLLQQMFV